ncbi:MAG: peptidoglycan DD-metalloendopeptidase family protein, partial [Pseudomonadota bacterium]
VWAQTEPEAALLAADRLTQASEMLAEAKGASNRVKALTETVKAYEDGLDALREGLRNATIKEQALTNALAAREEEIARLLAVLQGLVGKDQPTVLLHPSGALGTARTGMILADVTPALEAKAAELRDQLEEVSDLRKLQHSAAERLRNGLIGAQQARTALSKALANREELPRRFTEDPEKTTALLAAADTLQAFASGLSSLAVDEAPGSLPNISDRKGDLVLPVEGIVLRKAEEADAAGIKRPGIVVAARAKALVVTPTAATMRYRGPLLDYGNVVILEPQAGILFVLAGLDVVYGEPGQVLPSGSPVGLMGGSSETEDDGLLTENSLAAGAQRSQTLYIEVRVNNTPVDPAVWFQTNEG